MKILVCVKQVLDPETVIKIDESARWIQIEGPGRHWMNRFDEFAVEEALLIKEAVPGARVDVVTVGPDRAASVLERALGMGGDHGVHIVTKNEGYQSPLITAARIAAYAQDKAYDLILTGVMAEDDMQGQVGPILAELLNLPWATSVILAQVRPDQGTVSVEREIEGGRRDMLDLDLPALLTIQTGTNKPRYPSLSNLLRAKKQNPETIDAASLTTAGSREDIVRVGYPQKSRSGLVLGGGRQEKAAALLKILRERSFI